MFWKSSIRRAMSAGGITAGPLLFCPPGTLREGGSSDELEVLGEAGRVYRYDHQRAHPGG